MHPVFCTLSPALCGKVSLQRAVRENYIVSCQGEQREIQRSNFTGKAAWSDSDGEEEYQSRCITVKGQPVKRHKPKQQDNHQHAAGMSGSPGDPPAGQCI